jgi:hypothetical protein
MKKYESYMESPFKVEGVEERQYITKEDEDLWEGKDGQLYITKKLNKNKRVLSDTMAYSKLFIDSMDMLMRLSSTALKVFIYSMCTIRPLQNKVVLHIPDVKIRTGFSSDSSVKSAICELIEANILAQKLGSSIEFWINPNIFFNGNRLRNL